MNDCRFGVSPVNYPDPDPDVGLGFYLAHLWLCRFCVLLLSFSDLTFVFRV